MSFGHADSVTKPTRPKLEIIPTVSAHASQQRRARIVELRVQKKLTARLRGLLKLRRGKREEVHDVRLRALRELLEVGLDQSVSFLARQPFESRIDHANADGR